MKCPHCLVDFHDDPAALPIGKDKDGYWVVVRNLCPACGKFALYLESGEPEYVMTGAGRQFHGLQQPLLSRSLIRPKGSSRPCPPEVPKKLAEDFLEACIVLPDSAKAAAALGRRCLQNLLLDAAKVKRGNLADQIQQVIDSGTLPADLTASIDYVRNIGNFAAHPIKSEKSGEILNVEPGEADWVLDVIESLFEFYFVRPATIRKRRDALDQKLQQAGKPPMK
jgi:hypothetical protein